MNVRIAALSVAALLSLAACTGNDTPETTPTPTPAQAVKATPTPTPTPTPDALAACGIFIGDGQAGSFMVRIPPSLTSIGGDITSDQLNELLDINEGLLDAIDVAPTDLARALSALNEPFQQAADAVAGGGGSLTMDTSHVAADVTEIMGLCVDAGFTIAPDKAAADAAAEEQRVAAEAEAARVAAEQAAAAQAAADAAKAAEAPASVHYANCSEVKAAGAAPIHAGDPGYSSKLDRDGDGVACES